MFGGFHIEMTIRKTFGDYLDSSGWTSVLIQQVLQLQAHQILSSKHLTLLGQGMPTNSAFLL